MEVKADWSWENLRRALGQIGVVVVAAGFIGTMVSEHDLIASMALVSVGVLLIGFSCMLKCKMEPLFWVALAAFFPLLVALVAVIFGDKPPTNHTF